MDTKRLNTKFLTKFYFCNNFVYVLDFKSAPDSFSKVFVGLPSIVFLQRVFVPAENFSVGLLSVL